MSNRQILVFTNCTSRKRGLVSSELLARTLPLGTYSTVSAEWAKRIDTAPKLRSAGELYCGRAITETLQSARSLAAEVAFFSAGLGIVAREHFVPTYSLTSSSRNLDSIDGRLTEPYSPSSWWRSLLRARKQEGVFARLVEERRPSLILLALAPGYLSMVREDLECVARGFCSVMRILGPRRRDEVPEALREQWLPYDDRLDDPASGFNGTPADFPHRALRHFASRIFRPEHTQSIAVHRQLVEASLRELKPYVRPRGVTASDEEVLAVIKALWNKCAGNRGRVLRTLRRHNGIACEQGRFRRLADRFEGKH